MLLQIRKLFTGKFASFYNRKSYLPLPIKCYPNYNNCVNRKGLICAKCGTTLIPV